MSNDISESSLLAERVGTLQAEKASLKKELKELEDRFHKEARKNIFERVWISLAIFLTICFVTLLISYPIYKAFTTSDAIRYCVVDSYPTGIGDRKFRLNGIVEWSTDYELGVFDTQEEAIVAAERLHCRIGR